MVLRTPQVGGQGRDATGTAHVPALDGLRGVAVLMVMFFHFTLITRLQHDLRDTSGLEGVIDWIADGGWAGVDLFFVLSGFLITGILLRARETRVHYFRNFYAHRVVRIFPLYYAMLFFLLVLLPLLVTIRSEELSQLQSVQLWHWTYSMNVWAALEGGIGADLFGTGHFWSLSVEEHFYLVWPAVVLWCGRRTFVAVCAVIVLISPVLRLVALSGGADPFVAYTLTPLRLDALALGALLAVVVSHERSASRLRRAASATALLSLAALGGLAWWKGNLVHLQVGMLVYGLTAFAALFASLVLLATAPERNLVRVVAEAAPLRAAGRYSYALYVMHWPIARWLVTVIDVPGVGDAHVTGRLLFVLIAGGASAVCAWLSWHGFERHFLRLKDRFREPAPAVDTPDAAELAAA